MTKQEDEDLKAAMNRYLGPNWSDIRSTLARSPSKRFATRPLSGIGGIAVHHSAGSKTGTPQAAARWHVDGRGFAGIGYHFWIADDGRVFYVGDLGTSRAHVLNQNDALTGIVLAGNFQNEDPSPAALASLSNLIAALEDFHGRRLSVFGHNGWAPSGYTECPGANLSRRLGDAVARARADGPRPGDPPGLADALAAFAQSSRRLAVNPAAGLLKAILGEGLIPIGNEGGVAGFEDLVAQAAEDPATGRVRVFTFDRTTGRIESRVVA